MLLGVVESMGSSRLARLRTGRTPILAVLGMTASLVVMGTVRSEFVAGLGTIGVLTLAGVWLPPFQVLQMKMVGPECRSVVTATCFMAPSIGFATTGLFGGSAVPTCGYRRVFLLGAVSAILSAALAKVISVQPECGLECAVAVGQMDSLARGVNGINLGLGVFLISG